MYEEASKIHRISDKCILAVSANDFIRALDIIDTLKSVYREDRDFSEIIKSLNDNLDLTEERGREVGFLIALSEKSESKLCTWSSARRELIYATDYCAIGSLPIHAEKPIRGLNNFLTSTKPIREDDLLIGMTAGIQSISLNGSFLGSYDVGGAIVGIELNESGIRWIDDTLYAISGPDGLIKNSVMVVNRDERFATSSSYTNSSLYLSRIDQKNTSLWMERWENSVEKVFDSLMTPNWVLINPLNNLIIIVRTELPSTKTSACHVKFQDGKSSIVVTDYVTEILRDGVKGIFIFDDQTALERLPVIAHEVRRRKAPADSP